VVAWGLKCDAGPCFSLSHIKLCCMLLTEFHLDKIYVLYKDHYSNQFFYHHTKIKGVLLFDLTYYSDYCWLVTIKSCFIGEIKTCKMFVKSLLNVCCIKHILALAVFHFLFCFRTVIYI